jgi:hypothetical protein
MSVKDAEESHVVSKICYRYVSILHGLPPALHRADSIFELLLREELTLGPSPSIDSFLVIGSLKYSPIVVHS